MLALDMTLALDEVFAWDCLDLNLLFLGLLDVSAFYIIEVGGGSVLGFLLFCKVCQSKGSAYSFSH